MEIKQLKSSDILPLIDLVQVIKANKVTVNLHLPHRFYYYLLSCILPGFLLLVFFTVVKKIKKKLLCLPAKNHKECSVV